MTKIKIYTRTGDQGTTSLFSGERVTKADPFIEALGAVDEGNSAIGFAVASLPKEPLFEQTREQLETIQHALFDLGAALAMPRSSSQTSKLEKTRFDSEAVVLIESWIDAMDQQLPPLHTFILPGGHPSGAALHVSRGIIRRAERLVVPLFEQQEVIQAVVAYLNRLSDYLFIASRYVNHLLNVPETMWEKHKIHNRDKDMQDKQ
jgi:cob(I)alamin adenosyltransferase